MRLGEVPRLPRLKTKLALSPGDGHQHNEPRSAGGVRKPPEGDVARLPNLALRGAQVGFGGQIVSYLEAGCEPYFSEY